MDFFVLLFLVSEVPLVHSVNYVLPSSIQLFSHKGRGFLLRADIFLPPSILSIYSFPFFYMPIFIPQEAAWKPYYMSHCHKITLEDKRKAKMWLRHQEIILRSPRLQQLNEDVKILFKDTTPAIFSGFPLLWKGNVLTSNFLLTPAKI